MPKYPNRFWIAALLIAWAVDFLIEKRSGCHFYSGTLFCWRLRFA